jgi:hypothetical protein
MLSLLLALLQPSPDVAHLDALAKARDVAGLAEIASADLSRDREPFAFLAREGVFGVGRFGWRALELRVPGRPEAFVVFSTPLTSQDIGEQLFELREGRLVRYVPETETLGHRILHHRIDVRFEVEAKRARLENVLDLERAPGAPDLLVMRMSPNYRVKRLERDGKAMPFGQAGGVVAVNPEGWPRRFSLRLEYEATVDLPDYAGSITPDEAMLTNDYWYPMIGRLPATHSVRVTAPEGWTVVAQGEPKGREGNVWSFDMTLPAVYFSLSAARLEEHQETIDGRSYAVWSPVMSREMMRRQVRHNVPVLQFYERTFGAYPFSRWGALESKVYGSGALEAYSHATYGVGWLPDEDAHEPAHTWWGGRIANTYLRSFWNESFAEFSEGLYRREAPIGNREERRRAFIRDAEPRGLFATAPLVSSGAEIGRAAGSLGYEKGAMVLQMLEAEMGTEALTSAMRHWVETHPAGVPGEWEDFERVVLSREGERWRTFFDHWLRRTDWIDVSLEEARWAGEAVEARFVWQGRPFQTGIEALLIFPDGTRQLRTVTLDADGKVTVPAARKPERISFDPWRRLLRRYGRDETPVQLDVFLRNARVYRDPAKPDWTGPAGRQTRIQELPESLDGVLIVGSPDTTPRMRELCRRVGFEVAGDRLTYRGTTIDLRQGAAMAVVDLEGGGRAAIALGRTDGRPQMGRARLVLVDDLGRFLRGYTEPKTSGFLTADIP